MEQPRDGFARVVAATWALVGAGVVGVVGASALAYADTSTHPLLTAVDASDPGATTAGPTAPGQVPTSSSTGAAATPGFGSAPSLSPGSGVHHTSSHGS
ncbi:hypothetical protein [Rhodococcus sp. ACPA1]|uniref:hypothetical protein n=1 Tax=Rhodococcus sp. ACPA1 TaxID=2028572 RepID=UPI000BB12B1B|nr:hypothetical protein [Rhodococcus sp. ACPA1]PBC47300.1 hypothetical protein CJ177_44225 [Rhodococcus sp. ACPA1]